MHSAETVAAGAEAPRNSSVGSMSDMEYEELDSPRSSVSPQQLQNMYRFHRKKQRGNVDVWWLFDDGGTSWRIYGFHYKQIKRVAKANKTRAFDRFYVCILTNYWGNVVKIKTVWLAKFSGL